MRFVEKFLLFLYTIITIFAGGFMIVMSFKGGLTINFGDVFPWTVFIAGAALILIGVIILLTVVFRSKKGGQDKNAPKVITGNNVELTPVAVEAIIKQTAKNIFGMELQNINLKHEQDGLGIIVNVKVKEEIDIIEATNTLKTKIQANLENVGGIKVSYVKVLVMDISAIKEDYSDKKSIDSTEKVEVEVEK